MIMVGRFWTPPAIRRKMSGCGCSRRRGLPDRAASSFIGGSVLEPRSIDQTLDRREAILERLFAIGQGLSGIASALRNPNPVPTGAKSGILSVPRPVFILFDGDTRLSQDVLPHKIAQMPATIWRMDPQLVVLLEQRDDFENTTLGADAKIGRAS